MRKITMPKISDYYESSAFLHSHQVSQWNENATDLKTLESTTKL